jgi:hypothetical protein
MRTTWGLPILGQDVVTSSSATWQLLFGQDKHRWAFVVNFIIIYICTAVPGGRFSNPPTSASPVRYMALYSPEIG